MTGGKKQEKGTSVESGKYQGDHHATAKAKRTS